MAFTTLSNGLVSRGADVTTAVTDSSNTFAVVDNSQLNAGPFQSVAYTLQNSGTDAMSYQVHGALLADYSDEQQVAAAAIAPAASAAYSVSPPPYVHYRVKVADAVSGSPGQITLAGTAK